METRCLENGSSRSRGRTEIWTTRTYTQVTVSLGTISKLTKCRAAGELAGGHLLPQAPCCISSTPGHAKFIGKKQNLKIELFLQKVYYYISIKSAARMETFLYAIEAQMLWDTVLMEFRVSKQPCYTNSRVVGIFKGSFRWPLLYGPKQKACICLNKGVNLLGGEIPFSKLTLTSSSSSHCHSPSAVELSQKP